MGYWYLLNLRLSFTGEIAAIGTTSDKYCVCLMLRVAFPLLVLLACLVNLHLFTGWLFSKRRRVLNTHG